MEGILALMIPVLALATGFVAMLRMPPETFGRKPARESLPGVDSAALVEEVAMLREELARVRERVDFTERLLMDGTPAARPSLSAPRAPAEPARAAPAAPAPSRALHP